MGKTNDPTRSQAEPRSFEACRTIDVTDEQAMRFWSQRLGVAPEAIAEVIREVGPNSTAVALKLEAPAQNRVAPR